MSARGRKALRFVAQFGLLFAASLWLYPRVLPAYERAVLATANGCLSLLSPRIELEHHAQGYIAGYRRLADGTRDQVPVGNGYRPEAVFAQLPLFIALLLATPMKIARLLKLFAVGLVLILVLHVLAVVVVFHARYGLQLNPRSVWCGWLGALALTSGQMGAFAVWGLLTWGYWFSLSQADGSRGEASA